MLIWGGVCILNLCEMMLLRISQKIMNRLKCIIVFALLILIKSVPSYAQSSDVSVFVGTNWSKLDGINESSGFFSSAKREPSTSAGAIGYQVGVSFTRVGNNDHGFRSGLHLIQKRSTLTAYPSGFSGQNLGEEVIDFSISQLKVPLLYYYQSNRNVGAYLGPSLEYNIIEKVVSSGSSLPLILNDYSFTLQVGLSFKVADIGCSFEWNNTLGDLLSSRNDADYSSGGFKNSFLINVSYSLFNNG